MRIKEKDVIERIDKTLLNSNEKEKRMLRSVNYSGIENCKKCSISFEKRCLDKLVNPEPVNNVNYDPKFKNEDTEVLTYSQREDGMEPEIFQGQIVLVLKRNYIFNEKNIYLVSSPYGIQIRRLKMILDETVQLVASNKKCNNEMFLIDDVQILGKVKIC